MKQGNRAKTEQGETGRRALAGIALSEVNKADVQARYDKWLSDTGQTHTADLYDHYFHSVYLPFD